MKKVIRCNQNTAKESQLKHAYLIMQNLLDVLDSMDEVTYSEFERYVTRNFYTDLADGIQDLSSRVVKGD